MQKQFQRNEDVCMAKKVPKKHSERVQIRRRSLDRVVSRQPSDYSSYLAPLNAIEGSQKYYKDLSLTST
jgi:hypothetical protein